MKLTEWDLGQMTEVPLTSQQVGLMTQRINEFFAEPEPTDKGEVRVSDKLSIVLPEHLHADAILMILVGVLREAERIKRAR